ncbi:MAG: hypothetical protein AB2989_06340 [Candidatus Symbiodolus clandestinus]
MHRSEQANHQNDKSFTAGNEGKRRKRSDKKKETEERKVYCFEFDSGKPDHNDTQSDVSSRSNQNINPFEYIKQAEIVICGIFKELEKKIDSGDYDSSMIENIAKLAINFNLNVLRENKKIIDSYHKHKSPIHNEGAFESTILNYQKELINIIFNNNNISSATDEIKSLLLQSKRPSILSGSVSVTDKIKEAVAIVEKTPIEIEEKLKVLVYKKLFFFVTV